jgi:sulfane dehydrogenase subunit SoxC
MADDEGTPDAVPVAGNGLLGRRALLRGGLGGAALLVPGFTGAAERPPWMRAPGTGMREYGAPSPLEDHVRRVGIASQPGTDGSGASRTPLELLEGTLTPSGLHFERHHSGVPAVDPGAHTLLVHGLVRRPLTFDLDALGRYPLETRLQFLECSGNSAVNILSPVPADQPCGVIHGLVSQSEWVGVPLGALLEEAGLRPEARWVVAEGADAAAMSRSVPLEKILDDAIVALYQNGERLRPENGYPMRLFLPGWEGNMSVKWLRRLRVTDRPAMTKDETSKYSDLLPDGSAELFTFPMGVKSVITRPSRSVGLRERGVYAVSGLAWSGAGRVRRVEVSADGGATWAEATLEPAAAPKALQRFRIAWRWDGGAAVLLSRATDETGAVQPTRSAILEARGRNAFYHYNGIQAWRVDADGSVVNHYA